MNKLIIACMDGASASFRRRHIRTYMSDVVGNIVNDHLQTTNGEGIFLKVSKKTMLYSPNINMESVRGGAIFSRTRKIRRFIEAHNQAGNTLLCVGKSYGGYNLIEMLKEFMSDSKYSKVVLFLVDACSLDKIIGQKKWIKSPKVDELYNFYQSNNRYMNGYWIDARGIKKYNQYDLSATPGINHLTITENESVKNELIRVIASLI